MRVLSLLSVFLLQVVHFGWAEIAMDGSVLVLDDTNFAEAITTHSQMLVEFYAPWCGHCKTLAPEWAKAAVTLADSPIKLAKVDATEATGLAKEFGIKGFPTIKYFNKGKPSDFSGGRTEKEIVSWVNKKSGPAAKTISTAEELEGLKEKHEVVVLGVFATSDSAAAQAFLRLAADSETDTPFFTTSTEEVRSSLGVAHDSVLVLKSFDEPRVDLDVSAGFDSEVVTSFVAGESVPLIQEFSQATSKKIFSSPITKHALVFTSKSAEHHETVMATTTAVSREYKGRVLFVNVPATSDNKRVLDYFDLKESDLPAAIMADMNPEGGNLKKFPFTGSFESSTDMAQHVARFLAGELKPHLKSEAVTPEDTAGDVVVVKGTSFHDLVINNDKDVLVEFYAPWCGHCKKLAPTWDELGKRFKGSNIVIAKMDATANEIDEPSIVVKGFPTIYWLRGDKKHEPVRYEEGRELEEIINFINEHAHNPVPAHDEL